VKVGDMVRLDKSRTTPAFDRNRRRMGVGTVGIIIEIGPKHQAGFSTPVRNNIKIKWLDTQQVTLHNEFFIEVINATSS
jgi:hypothetical protein